MLDRYKENRIINLSFLRLRLVFISRQSIQAYEEIRTENTDMTDAHQISDDKKTIFLIFSYQILWKSKATRINFPEVRNPFEQSIEVLRKNYFFQNEDYYIMAHSKVIN